MKNAFSIFLFLCLIACTDNTPTNTPSIKPVTEFPNWFSVRNLEENTFILEERVSSQKNVIYVLAGEQRAFVFDTGSGENPSFEGSKIKFQLERISPLPFTLMISHFHFDHTQNLNEFDHIAFADIPSLKNKTSTDSIYTFSDDELFSGSEPVNAKISEWIPLNTDIDLGNRIIQILHTPGHTTESIAIIDKTNKFAFLGDFLYNGTLFLFDQNDLDTYNSSIDLLLSTIDSNYTLFGAHGVPQIDFSTLESLKNFIKCIKDGNCVGVSDNVFGKSVKVYQFEGLSLLIFQ